MRVNKLKTTGAAWLLATLPIAAGAQPFDGTGDPWVNRTLAAQCAQCHGTDGHAVGNIDSLAGEGAEIREELFEMKREDRPDDIMDHQALGYTDEQIRRIAAWYDSAPPRPDGGGEDDDDRDGDDDDRDDDSSRYHSDDDEDARWYRDSDSHGDDEDREDEEDEEDDDDEDDEDEDEDEEDDE